MLNALDCDLVDEDEVREEWLTTLSDTPNMGPVREAVERLPALMLN